MPTPISALDAAEQFDVPTEVLYVCDGERECGKPACLDHSNSYACHHTADPSHALYAKHDADAFDQYPSVRGGEAVTILVEPLRG